MSISFKGNRNPEGVIYNGKSVSEVWYKSDPNAEAVKVWPDDTGLKAYFKKVFVKKDKAYYDGINRISTVTYSYYDLYFRGTPAEGYVEYTGGEINNEYQLRSAWVVNKVYSEEPFKLPENINGMFNNCYNVTSIDLSLADTTNVKYMAGLFSDTFSLQTIDISGFTTSQITDMGGMFGVYGGDAGSKQSALSRIYVGDGWDVSNVTVDTNMFTKCVKLPNWNWTTDKSKAYVGPGGYLSKK